MTWKLVDANGVELKRNAPVRTFRNEPVRIVSFRPPHKPSSTGRVYVRDLDGEVAEFYPGVINARIVPI